MTALALFLALAGVPEPASPVAFADSCRLPVSRETAVFQRIRAGIALAAAGDQLLGAQALNDPIGAYHFARQKELARWQWEVWDAYEDALTPPPDATPGGYYSSCGYTPGVPQCIDFAGGWCVRRRLDGLRRLQSLVGPAYPDRLPAGLIFWVPADPESPDPTEDDPCNR